jgi:hypothetical protein
MGEILMKWEYKTLSYRWMNPWEGLGEYLDRYGEDGWEVITVEPNHIDIKILMKRPKPFKSGAY